MVLKIGLIVGKDDWYTEDYKEFTNDRDNPIDKKFLTGKGRDAYISSDIAIAHQMMKDYPDAEIDMMLSKDVKLKRLESNDVNFILGHDLVDAFWRKKKGGNYYDEFTKLYKNPKARIFPTYPVQKFVLDKGEYYLKFKRAGVPVLPTFYIKNTEKKKLNATYVINRAKRMGWDEFIGKPELGAWGRMFSKWNLEKLMNNKAYRQKLDKYLKNPKVTKFPAIIFQKSAPGFKEYWEIRTYWFNGKFSHALGTKHNFDTQDDDLEIKIDPKILRQCKTIGRKAINVLPKMKIKGKEVKPAMIRVDCGCCTDGLNGKYFLNEIENQGCNLFIEATEMMNFPIAEKFAKVLYNKAKELKGLGWHAPGKRRTSKTKLSRPRRRNRKSRKKSRRRTSRRRSKRSKRRRRRRFSRRQATLLPEAGPELGQLPTLDIGEPEGVEYCGPGQMMFGGKRGRGFGAAPYPRPQGNLAIDNGYGGDTIPTPGGFDWEGSPLDRALNAFGD